MQFLEDKLIDELIEIRRLAREDNNFTLSDQVRTEMDSRGSFVVDTPEGQVVYHLGLGWTRAKFLIKVRELDETFLACSRFKQQRDVLINQSGSTSGAQEENILPRLDEPKQFKRKSPL